MPTVQFKGIRGGDKLRERLQKLASMHVTAKVGFLDRATYPDGTSVAYVAYVNEYGRGNPPRPFLKQTENRCHKKWTKGIIHALIASGSVNQANMKKAYEMAAQVAVGDVKKAIKSWPSTEPVPNSPATIRRKAKRGRSGRNLAPIDPGQVLIDTGRMIAAVGYEVKIEK